jgi:hypothetical protein
MRGLADDRLVQLYVWHQHSAQCAGQCSTAVQHLRACASWQLAVAVFCAFARFVRNVAGSCGVCLGSAVASCCAVAVRHACVSGVAGSWLSSQRVGHVVQCCWMCSCSSVAAAVVVCSGSCCRCACCSAVQHSLHRSKRAVAMSAVRRSAVPQLQHSAQASGLCFACYSIRCSECSACFSISCGVARRRHTFCSIPALAHVPSAQHSCQWHSCSFECSPVTNTAPACRPSFSFSFLQAGSSSVVCRSQATAGRW